ncbi:MAG TPA: PilZ domain-containing protein [Terriglobales bacterium]|jgi:DNA-binding NarL/FixJ family response regulator|nr:PilZ domain-containing protein [Terriglobales bacterium]
MALTSLVVCADAKAVQVLTRALHDQSIDVDHSGDLHSAVDRLNEKPYDVVLVDCEKEDAALQLIISIRAKFKKDLLIIAIVEATNDVREIFARGASFALYKPVSAERVASTLRAARGVMPNERRKKPRVSTDTTATIAYADVENAQANLINLSEEGVAIRSGRVFSPKCKVYFQFSLPEQNSMVKLSGEVVWQDALGRVGLRFSRVPQASKALLDGWLRDHSKKNLEAGPFVLDIGKVPAGGLGLLAVSAPDRRVDVRHACRLGAEVYRSGGKAPQRCTLTDISSGGCYVETTEPIASGTQVELVVKTDEVRLKLSGRVHATHPGYGMGVEFIRNTEQQREQVKQLIGARDHELETQ